MDTVIEQFQVDYYENGTNAVVGSRWLQELLKERDKLKHEVLEEKNKNRRLEDKVSRLEARVLELTIKDKNIYILDTLA